MKVQVLGNLLSKYDLGIIILNEMEEILWEDNILENIGEGKNLLNKSFSEIFKFSAMDLIKKERKLKTLSGRIFNMFGLYLEDEKIYIVNLHEITNLNNKDIKLYCLEKIIESICDGVIISDHDGRIVLYNKAQENLEGLSSKFVVGKHLWEAYEYNPEFEPEMAEHKKVFKTKEPIIEKYRAHVFKNGVPKYLSYSTYPIIKDGEAIAVYSISKNETSLQALLSETIELKRKLFSTIEVKEKNYKNNGTTYTFEDIIGDSEVTKNVIREAQTIGMLNNSVLIVGETGTGKEVFAQSIHNFGKNKDEPFVAINCAAIPENLLESILFGTVKGAYTGAITQSGLFEEARKGTLFLDELNSMPISMQSKLLRVLQEKVVRRVGSSSITPIQCRVISAINEDPLKLIKEERLRQDLFYRIAGLCLYIPSLRERKEDIISIGEFFIRKYNKLLNKSVETFSIQLRKIMFSYKWPGNIRELEHFTENAMVRVKDGEKELVTDHVPIYIKNVVVNELSNNEKSSLPDYLKSIERKMILEGLGKNKWNLTQTAKDLGIIRQSLEYRLKKLNIKRPEDKY
ncbi:sigma-54 interaction domain-containing protein [Clostridium lundense]|uniref:sigma-54 interaction domain-containing protein n=1 Tax=Clostridium lundense TaxID=319475 RepID=UPI000686F072|nr:sigma-54-dependent Fis family transcriptional regulator [Clostridium lundense]